MPWDFSTEPEFAEKLAWVRAFVRDEIEGLDLLFEDESVIYQKSHPVHAQVVRPLQEKVKANDLWACHLGPELAARATGR